MQLGAASNLAGLLLRHSRELNSYLQELERRNDPDLQSARIIVGKIMGEIYVAGLYRIFREYPELTPSSFPRSNDPNAP